MRKATTSAALTHTRTTGVRVLRSDTVSWVLPYCSRCLDHVEACEQQSAAAEAHRLRRLACTQALAYLIALVVIGCLSLMLAIASSRNGRREAAIFFAALSASSVVGSVVAFLFLLYRRQRAARAEQLASQAAELLRTIITPSCCWANLAVLYTYRNGTLHGFTFGNAEYAELFREQNAPKLIDPRSLPR
jgi:hypothetical protein